MNGASLDKNDSGGAKEDAGDEDKDSEGKGDHLR